MATTIPTEPPRIVCTKCVRIVRVQFHASIPRLGGTLVAYECCSRTLGVASRDAEHRGDLTTNDISPYNDLEHYIQRCSEIIDDYAKRRELARWAMSTKENT